MSKKAFDKIAEGLNEALCIARAEAKPAKLQAANASATAADTKAQTLAAGFALPWLPAAQREPIKIEELQPNDLRTPISRVPVETLRYLARDEEDLQRLVREEDEWMRAIQARKLVALFHYLNNVETPQMTTWREFALRLATKAYPGLRIVTGTPKKQGAPRKWKGARGAQLVAEVSAIMESQRKNADHALRILLEFKGVKRRDFDKQFKALKRRYYEALSHHA